MELSQPKFSGLSLVTDQVLYKTCDREQIHLLGHIQPHGILIGIDEAKLTILQISDNTDQFLGLPTSSLINQPLSTIFPQSQIDILLSFLSHEDLEVFNPIKMTIQVKRKKILFQGIIHRSDGLLILELEPISQEQPPTLGFYYLAKASAINVRQAEGFDETSELLVKEIRKITGYDRVLIYKFDLDNSGVVIAENKAEHLESLLGLHYPAFDIPTMARQLYYRNWLRLIVNLNYEPVPIVPENNPLTNKPLDLSLSTLRSVSNFHVKYLQKMGVTASLGISLINSGRLWGLIVCHHYSPKYIDYETRKTCEFLGQIMSVEIVNKHDQHLKRSQEKIKNIQLKLKQNILSGYHSIDRTFSNDTDSLLSLVNAQGAVICLGNHISMVGVCPSSTFVNSLVTFVIKKAQDVLHTNCLSEIYPEALAIKEQVSGLLSISISLNHTSYHIIWFRPEIVQTVDWAGDPSKLVDIDVEESTDPSPRRSFELWKETVKAKSLPWDEVEVEAALELRSTLMLAALEFSQQALKQEAEHSEVANQAKSKFLARMSHELRTPLNAILGCTQLMQNQDSPNQEFGDYVNIISHSSEHLLKLIDDVLEISKIEAGKLVIEKSLFDFHLFLNNLQEMLRLKAQDKNLQLIFALHPNLPKHIQADEGKVRQILLNLLGNAIKFTDQGYVILRVSLITPEIESAEVTIHFEIEDTGKGISPEEIDNLFEAFVQTASGRESQTGTGLGLVISQQFAQFMGGQISVKSTLGRGTTFQFDIIVEKTSGESSELIFPDKRETTSFKKSRLVINQLTSQQDIAKNIAKRDIVDSWRILLVEDNEFNQMIALRLLAKLGYQADCAVNGAEVLDAIKQKDYDLILMDLQMPVMDGLEATRRIRLLERGNGFNHRIKIIAMTANAMAEDREKCMLMGMDDFISKPVRIETLAAVLERHKNAV